MPKPELLSLDAALEQLLALADPLPGEDIDLALADGRILAQAVAARLTLPAADVSAMDGYALRFADLPGPLRVVGESAAGRPLGVALKPGEAARIFTGALLPAGADTVALQEDAAPGDGSVAFPADGPPGAGAHVRRAGQDFAAGAPLAAAGTRLSPARLGLLAAAGHAAVRVHRRPRVALMSTGDELVPPGTTPGPGQIVGSNGPMIAAMLRAWGADVSDLGLVPDSRDALLACLASARGADLVVTIGGASVGDHDLVKPVLEEAGARIDLWRVAIRPGKPLLAGRLGNAIVVGLPGNPVSAHVCALLFLRPLLARMTGASDGGLPSLEAVCTVALPPNGPRRHFLRALLENGRITPFEAQDSSLYTVLAAANALLVRPENAPACPAGTAVPVLTL